MSDRPRNTFCGETLPTMVQVGRREAAGSAAKWLRTALVSTTVLVVSVPPVFANVLISVDKGAQRMSVSVDGVPKYEFAVSTGRAGYGTPSGTFHPEHMERTWFSKEYYNSPMPHSIFFHGGFAIHGSYEISRLGGPASHGCIRLHPSNAAALYALVKSEGMDATTIVVSGSSPSEGHAVQVARSHVRPQTTRTYNQPYGYYNTPYSPNYGTPYSPNYGWSGTQGTFGRFYSY